VFVVAWLLIGAWLAGDFARFPLGAGDPLPTEEEALEVFAPLHANVYRAFDFTEEGDVYDALALCVEGPLLERLYEEIYRSLAQEEAGGAVGRVQGLTPLEAHVVERELLDGLPQYGVEARWQLAASEITEQVLISATQDRPGEDGLDELPEEL
jgi:hypothetical protein